MPESGWKEAILRQAPSPAFVVHTGLLERNLAILSEVAQASGAKILLALKGFAMRACAEQISRHLSGITASGLHEAKLGAEYFGGEIHVYSPAFRPQDMDETLATADHLIFNSPAEWKRYRQAVQQAGRTISCGLRVNPEHSDVEVELYNPCAKRSRLGTRRDQLEAADLDGLEGLHFHTCCEQNVDALENSLKAFEAKFGEFLPKLRWVNFGGGHHITRRDYEVDTLIALIRDFRKRYPKLTVYLEPGEAIAIHTGVLVATVLDVLENEGQVAILDTSATCHMPDVLEMPYRPEIEGAGEPGEFAHDYRLGGLSCLAGDIIGDYSFRQPLRAGDRLLFRDMAHYTMVKTSTFNGVPLPTQCLYHPERKQVEVVNTFGYEDFRARL